MKNLTVLTIILLCGGCASLDVDVAILERSIVDELVAEDSLHDALPVIQAENKQIVDARVTQIENAHHQVYVKTSNKIFEEIDTLCKAEDKCDNALAEDFKDPLKSFVEMVNDRCKDCDDKLKVDIVSLAQIADGLQYGQRGEDQQGGIAYESFKSDWHAVNQKVRKLADARESTKDEAENLSLRSQISSALAERDQTLTNYFTRIEIDLDLDSDQAASINAEIQNVADLLGNDSVLKTYLSAVGAIVTNINQVELFDSGGFEHSKYASVVVDADDEYWAKQSFDTAKGGGYFGNVDVAIKAIGPTNFTIKGLSFNPSDVAAAASKVTTQAVLLAAQIAGVPVDVEGAPTGDGASLAKSSSTLQEVRNNVIESQTQLAGFDDAIILIANTIISEVEGVKSDDQDQMKESLKVINSAYASQQSRLDLSSGGGS